MNNYYVYLHIKADSGEPFYVGKGINNRASKIQDRSQFWNSVVNKHGFDIMKLEINLSEKESFEREKYWIQRIGRRDLGFGPLVNLTDGGEGANKSEETIRKISLAKMGSTPWNKNKKTGPLPKEHREKIAIANTGRFVSEESRLKSSISNTGLKRSDETKQKLSVMASKKTFDKNPNAKVTLQFDIDNNFIKEWNSIILASKTLNISAKGMSNCCIGKTKTSGGYKWKFKN